MGETKIEWTDRTWNPVRGCSRVSEGCRNCYAEKVAARFSGVGMAYEGLAKRGPARWTGEVRLIEEHLSDPLKWRKPQRVFVNSMSDLFHEGLSDADIDRVFAVMALSSRHTFQVLTKRPKRMLDYMRRLSKSINPLEAVARELGYTFQFQGFSTLAWPIRNVHLGVSVEDRKTYKERVPHLALTPAAVRFLSIEPLLEDLGDMMLDGVFGGAFDWVIVGGESGPGARPCELAWIRSVVEQCSAANVPVFVKQLGSKFAVDYYDHEYREEYEAHGWEWPEPMNWNTRHGQPPNNSRVHIQLKDHKGGDMGEWPADLRVRQFPA